MNKEALDAIPPEKRKFMAVSYLIREEKERPEGTEKLFEKLTKLETAATQTSSVISATEQSLAELNQRFMQTLGSLQTITELIADELPKEKIQEWCEKYTPPSKLPSMPGSMSMPGNKKIIQPGPADIAGLSAQQS